MTRKTLFALVLAAACSPKAPVPSETGPQDRSAQAGAAIPTPATPLPAADPREKALATYVSELFENEHLLRKKLDDSISKEAFKNYLETLDPGKMFLLASDRDSLSKYADKIDDELHNGSLDLAHDGQKAFTARVEVVQKVVEGLLAKPFDFTNEEYVELDADKLDLAKSEDELKERWRQRLELEVLERVASMEARLKADAEKKAKATAPKGKADKKDDKKAPDGAAVDEDDDEDNTSAPPVAQIPTTPEGREAKAREEIAKTYSGRFARMKTPGQLDAASDLVNAVASTLDPHTTYLPPAEKANFDIRMSGSLEGIGAVLREKEHLIEIVEIVPGGAAYRQGGLVVGDLIESVQQENKDPVDVFDMRIDDVVAMIRGPKGTTVRLRVQKAGGEEKTIAITRDVVVIEESYAKGAILQPKGSKATYGYIHLPSFYGGKGSPRSADDDMKKLLDQMRDKKVAGVIIDIRSNGGGLLTGAINISDHLIDKGPVVQVKDSDGDKEVLSGKVKGEEYDGPVIVLVDRFSASASEILAGALQDYGRAVIVGAGGTHGKGSVQTLADLDRATNGQIELGVLKITIQQFYRPDGDSVQLQGVTPDVMLPDPTAYIDSGESELKHAIPASKIEAAPFVKWPVQYNMKDLAAASANRVGKSPLLSKIASATAVLRSRKNDTKVPLQKAAWEKRRDDQKAQLDAASPDLKKVAPVFMVKPLEEPAAPAAPDPTMPDGTANPNAKGPKAKDDKATKWRDNLARDPWVEETLNIMGDMTQQKVAATTKK
ncbi:MAG TPA: carboxy terminal-processing peptidase [Kofleriaceae bacterium]|nr:carboxy terminal-processing peptidase [Kofleriaceae bacterium]